MSALKRVVRGPRLWPEAGQASRAPAPSFADVYGKHHGYVHRALRHLGVREAAVEDAVQDTFVVVHDKLAAFDGQSALTTWLYAIVIRVARRYREQQGKAARFDSDAELASEGHAEEHLDRVRKLALAHAALDALDDDKREVFVLSEIEQMAAPEIAAIVGVPVNTVYSRLRVAKEQFELRVRRAELQRRGSR